MGTQNGFELFARDKKLGKLQAAAIRVEQQTGASRAESLSFWRNANDAEWSSLAVLAGCRPASEQTRKAFLEAMAQRAGVL